MRPGLPSGSTRDSSAMRRAQFTGSASIICSCGWSRTWTRTRDRVGSLLSPLQSGGGQTAEARTTVASSAIDERRRFLRVLHASRGQTPSSAPSRGKRMQPRLLSRQSMMRMRTATTPGSVREESLIVNCSRDSIMRGRARIESLRPAARTKARRAAPSDAERKAFTPRGRRWSPSDSAPALRIPAIGPGSGAARHASGAFPSPGDDADEAERRGFAIHRSRTFSCAPITVFRFP